MTDHKIDLLEHYKTILHLFTGMKIKALVTTCHILQSIKNATIDS